MRTRHYILPALIISTLSSYSLPAFAEKWDKGHGKGQDKYDSRRDDHRDRERIIIHDNDRVVIRQYLANDYRRHRNCPPGLAKKHNGCLPPGHVKHYVIGQPLPQYVEYYPVPRPLLVRLQPVPYGYRYVMVDNDVLLMSEASHHIIDAITLMSAVGN